jgi:hypothetical protein
MTSFNQIGPWITAGLLFAIIVFFCAFYISRLLKIKRNTILLSADVKQSDDIGSVKTIISNEQKNKLKEEIVHDIVADITPMLKKRLEKAF